MLYVRAGRKRSPIKFDDDDAGNEFTVSDGSHALISDYMGHPNNYQGLESMQITFKSPGGFKRASTLGSTPGEAAGADTPGGDGSQDFSRSDNTSDNTSPDRFQGHSPGVGFPTQGRSDTEHAAMNVPSGLNFSPSVFFRNTPGAMQMKSSPKQMVDGFVVPSPSMSQSAQKKRSHASNRSNAAAGNSNGMESARKRAAGPKRSSSAPEPTRNDLSPPSVQIRRTSRELTPQSDGFDLGASAGFSDERIGILSPSEGELELTGRESLGTVVSLRVSAGSTPSPALKSVMQSIAMQSRSAAALVSPARRMAAPANRASANKTAAVPTFDSVEAASDGGLSTQLERDKTLGRSSSMSEVERGVLSVNLAAQKFSPVAAAEPMQEDHDEEEEEDEHEDEEDDESMQQPQMGQSPASFYRSATGQSPYASNETGGSMTSPGDSEMSSPTSSPCAPSPTAEERREAAECDRSLVDQLVQPISHPISQEWHASPASTAWCVASPRNLLVLCWVSLTWCFYDCRKFASSPVQGPLSAISPPSKLTAQQTDRQTYLNRVTLG